MNQSRINYDNLIDEFKSGDKQAFKKLYLGTYHSVNGVVTKILGSKYKDEIPDIIQDTYLKAMVNIDSLKERQLFPAWINTIARNTSLTYLKKKKSTCFTDEGAAIADANNNDISYEETITNNHADFDPDICISNIDRAAIIDEILESLSDKQRVVISMYYYEELKIDEIAHELDIPVGTVKTRILNAKKHIKAKIEEYKKRGYQFGSASPFNIFNYLMQLDKHINNEPASTFSDKIEKRIWKNIKHNAKNTFLKKRQIKIKSESINKPDSDCTTFIQSETESKIDSSKLSKLNELLNKEIIGTANIKFTGAVLLGLVLITTVAVNNNSITNTTSNMSSIKKLSVLESDLSGDGGEDELSSNGSSDSQSIGNGDGNIDSDQNYISTKSNSSSLSGSGANGSATKSGGTVKSSSGVVQSIDFKVNVPSSLKIGQTLYSNYNGGTLSSSIVTCDIAKSTYGGNYYLAKKSSINAGLLINGVYWTTDYYVKAEAGQEYALIFIFNLSYNSNRTLSTATEVSVNGYLVDETMLSSSTSAYYIYRLGTLDDNGNLN